jgi:hypothetical protein
MLARRASRYGKLKWLRDSNLITVNCALVRVVSLLRLAPAGMQDVHDMLVKVSLSLVQARPRFLRDPQGGYPTGMDDRGVPLCAAG